jgi:hypothetical protein
MKHLNEGVARLQETIQQGMEAHNRAIAEHDSRMVELDQKLDRIADMLGFRGGNGTK